MSSRSSVGPGAGRASHVESGDRFSCLFAGQLDELQTLADHRGVELAAVAECYSTLANTTDTMLSHSELQRQLGLSASQTWDVASVLVDFGEIHRSKDSQWWWVYASGYLAELCRERELSLKRYIEMRPALREFQDEVTRWFEIRHMHGNLQPKTMGQIKLECCRRLQVEYWGLEADEEIVGEETWSDHRVSRYVRTAQDEIVEAYNLTY